MIFKNEIGISFIFVKMLDKFLKKVYTQLENKNNKKIKTKIKIKAI